MPQKKGRITSKEVASKRGARKQEEQSALFPLQTDQSSSSEPQIGHDFGFNDRESFNDVNYRVEYAFQPQHRPSPSLYPTIPATLLQQLVPLPTSRFTIHTVEEEICTVDNTMP
jgi:hypothetical protein